MASLSATFKPNKDLLNYFVNRQIFANSTVQQYCKDIWDKIPEANKWDDMSDDEISTLILQNADAFIDMMPAAPVPAKGPGKVKTATELSNIEKKVTYSNADITALQEQASAQASRDFDNNYQKGLDSQITAVYTARPNALIRLKDVKDFVPTVIEDAAAQWAEWESKLPKENVMPAPKKGATLDPATKPRIDAKENRAKFAAIKEKYEKQEKFAIFKSEAKSPICGIQVTGPEGNTADIPTQASLLALKLVQDYGGQIGHTDDKESLSATVTIYTKNKVSVGNNITVPIVKGLVKGLAKYYQNSGTVINLYDADTTGEKKAVTVQSQDYFMIENKPDKNGRMTYKRIRMKGKVEVTAYTDARGRAEYPDFFTKTSSKPKSATTKSGAKSTSLSNATAEGRLINRQIAEEALVALMTQGTGDTAPAQIKELVARQRAAAASQISNAGGLRG